jgi:hypothetical protein
MCDRQAKEAMCKYGIRSREEYKKFVIAHHPDHNSNAKFPFVNIALLQNCKNKGYYCTESDQAVAQRKQALQKCRRRVCQSGIRDPEALLAATDTSLRTCAEVLKNYDGVYDVCDNSQLALKAIVIAKQWAKRNKVFIQRKMLAGMHQTAAFGQPVASDRTFVYTLGNGERVTVRVSDIARLKQATGKRVTFAANLVATATENEYELEVGDPVSAEDRRALIGSSHAVVVKVKHTIIPCTLYVEKGIIYLKDPFSTPAYKALVLAVQGEVCVPTDTSDLSDILDTLHTMGQSSLAAAASTIPVLGRVGQSSLAAAASTLPVLGRALWWVAKKSVKFTVAATLLVQRGVVHVIVHSSKLDPTPAFVAFESTARTTRAPNRMDNDEAKHDDVYTEYDDVYTEHDDDVYTARPSTRTRQRPPPPPTTNTNKKGDCPPHYKHCKSWKSQRAPCIPRAHTCSTGVEPYKLLYNGQATKRLIL